MSNPFDSAPAVAGTGTIHLALLPPSTPRLRTLSYQYPLKLISPAPLRSQDRPHHMVHTVYLLTYGGGLVAGDAIDLSVTVEETTRLVLLTQGSTKLFKSPSHDVRSHQCMSVRLHGGAGLCYLPDPVQPFEKSSFQQQQVYNIMRTTTSVGDDGSLCVLDWASNGRPANGENWSFHRYASKNEIYTTGPDRSRKLLLRDSVLLDDNPFGIAGRMDGLAVHGTLILYGPLFELLGHFFMTEFKSLPRIGGRKWDSGSESGEEADVDPAVLRRGERHRRETAEGLLWSAATVRDCVVIKFGAREVEHGRRWLHGMLYEDGSIVREFGERALLCLR